MPYINMCVELEAIGVMRVGRRQGTALGELP